MTKFQLEKLNKRKLKIQMENKEINKLKSRLKGLATAMYNVNRQISWKFIAMNDKPTEQIMTDLNRFIGEWIKQLRKWEEDLK